MKETVERNGRFYTNEKGEIKTENEQLKEWLVIANKEIERLKEEYVMLQNASDEVEEEKDKEIEKLNTIIEIKTNRIQDLMSRLSKRQDRIDKAIEYIEENKTTHECNEWGFDNMLEDIIPLLDILKGVDKE